MNLQKALILPKPAFCLFKTGSGRKLCTQPSEPPKLDTISMSFASYESTRPMADNGPAPLIIMHGLFGSKRNWNSLCKAFHKKTSPQRKIIAVDARNHGESPHSGTHSYPHLAEDIRAFLDQFKLKKAALLGHSMGGRAVMYFALRYPELVDKLIVADISPVRTSPNLASMSSIFAAVRSVNLPRNVPMSMARVHCDSQLSKSISDKGLRSFLLTNLVQDSNGSYIWRINIPVLLEHFSEHIACFPDVSSYKFNGPVLFVSGGTSDFIQKADHKQILNMFPNAEFFEIDGAGHWLHSDKPNEFLDICTEFLNRTVI